MRTLILYATKTGTAEKCAKLLAERLSGAEVRRLGPEPVDLAPWDTVAVGGSVRMGTLHPDCRRFLERQGRELLEKRAGYFISNGMFERGPELLEQLFPQKLRDRALCLASFGGELDLSRQRGLDKLVARMAVFAMKDGEPARIHLEEIEAFARKLEG